MAWGWAVATVDLLLWVVPAAIGIAILRHRLYDIDWLVSRTVSYGLLTAVLGLGYAGAVLILGQLFGGVTGDPPARAVADATLTVAAVFRRLGDVCSTPWIDASTVASTMRPS